MAELVGGGLLSRAAMEEDATVQAAAAEGRLESRVVQMMEKPVQRALKGDLTALSKEEAERHLQLLVQGAQIKGEQSGNRRSRFCVCEGTRKSRKCNQ